MKKHYIGLLVLPITLAMMLTSCTEKENNGDVNESNTENSAFTADGATKSFFSVAPGHTVRFSRGNLEYNAAQGSHTTADGQTLQGTWRFSPCQYDTIYLRNRNVSPSYDGWQNIFSWGQSGWNSGAIYYHPWETVIHCENRELWPGGDSTADLTGQYANADWAYYNAISNGGNRPCLWRTPTKDEWDYLINNRNASTVNGTPNARYAPIFVNDIFGVMIFPDNYSHPTNVPLPEYINTPHITTGNPIDTVSRYTPSEWNKFEKAGCIFLPSRKASSWGGSGFYWSVTSEIKLNKAVAYKVTFMLRSNTLYFLLSPEEYYWDHFCVRPIQDIR